MSQSFDSLEIDSATSTIKSLTSAKAEAEAKVAECRRNLFAEKEILASLITEPETSSNVKYLKAAKHACQMGIKAWYASIVAYQHDVDIYMLEINEILEHFPELRSDQMMQEKDNIVVSIETPKADVILIDPTRYAVALRYSEEEMDTPQVIAKGLNLQTESIRELGIEHSFLPIFSIPPLARALYRHVELNQDIPYALFPAVAAVFAYIFAYRSINATGRSIPKFPEPSELKVPEEMSFEDETH